jgi:hypothetical protein
MKENKDINSKINSSSSSFSKPSKAPIPVYAFDKNKKFIEERIARSE